METKEYLKYIVEEIHTTIVATVDDEGLPVTARIPYVIEQEHCLHCGNCMSVCPAAAIIRR